MITNLKNKIIARRSLVCYAARENTSAHFEICLFLAGICSKLSVVFIQVTQKVFLAFRVVGVRRLECCCRLVSLRLQITQTRLKCTVASASGFSRRRASRHFPRLYSSAITFAGRHLSKGLRTNYGFSATLREETHTKRLKLRRTMLYTRFPMWMVLITSTLPETSETRSNNFTRVFPLNNARFRDRMWFWI